MQFVIVKNKSKVFEFFHLERNRKKNLPAMTLEKVFLLKKQLLIKLEARLATDVFDWQLKF